VRSLEKITGVLAGHVGYAADLALAPEQLVVVEGGHLIEMNCIDGDHAAFSQAGECADDHFSAGSEGDGAVELDGWFRIFVAHPGCAESSGASAMGFTPGDDVDLAFPGLQYGNREAGGTAKAEESNALGGFNAGDPEATETDDPSAEQRRDVDVVQSGGQWIDEVGAGERIFGITAVDGISGENRVVTQIFFAVKAISTIAVDSAHPRDSDSGSARQIRSRAGDDFANDLMAGNEPWVERGQIAFDDVKVGAADSTGYDAEQDVAGLQRGTRDIFELKKVYGWPT